MKEKTLNEKLLAFEKYTELGSSKAAKLLGVAYVTYAQLRAGSRPMQKYMECHIETIMMLNPRQLDDLIGKRVYGE